MNFPEWKAFSGSGTIRFEPFTDTDNEGHHKMLDALKEALAAEFHLKSDQLGFMAYINSNGVMTCDPTGRVCEVPGGKGISFSEFVQKFDDMMKKLKTGQSLEPAQAGGSRADDDILDRYQWTYRKDGTLESEAVSTMGREHDPIQEVLGKRLESHRVNTEVPERVFYKDKDIKLRFVKPGSIYEGARVVVTGLSLDAVKQAFGINPAVER